MMSLGDRHRWRKIFALLLVLSFVFYLPCLFLDFFADDDLYLSFAFRIGNQHPWYEIPFPLLGRANPWEYLPIRDFTYWIDYRFFGDDAYGYHASNLGWYGASIAANGWLVHEVLTLYRPAWTDRKFLLVLCGMILFTIHPAHLEAVAWIASRKDLIGGTLSLLAAASTVRGIRQGWRVRYLLLAAACLLGACLGKASAITMSIFLTVLAIASWNKPSANGGWVKGSFVILVWMIVIAISVIHFNVGTETNIRIGNDPGFSVMWERASRILTTLAMILLLPIDLGLHHDVFRLGFFHWLVSSGLVFLFCYSVVKINKGAIWTLGCMMFFSSILVYLQFVPFTTWSLASERFVFLGVAGLVLVLVDILGRIDSPKIIFVIVMLIVVPCGGLLWNRLSDWESDATLFAHEIDRNPRFSIAAKNLIVYVLFPASRYQEAIETANKVTSQVGRELLIALIDVDEAYMEVRRRGGSSTNDASVSVDTLCKKTSILERRLSLAEDGVKLEADVSINNLINALRKEIDFTYSNMLKACSPWKTRSG